MGGLTAGQPIHKRENTRHMTGLCALPATEQARLVRRREVSPVDLVEASLARIEAVHPVLNAFCFVFPEEARAQAREAEAAVMRGDPLGPLHGLPVAFKDFTPTSGHRTTRGSYCFEHWVADADPVIVRRFKQAGAIIVGKTTTPEFAHSGFTQSPLWGLTGNPWDPARSSGGSSGGSGVAAATGCVALAEGTDMGGSVRMVSIRLKGAAPIASPASINLTTWGSMRPRWGSSKCPKAAAR